MSEGRRAGASADDGGCGGAQFGVERPTTPARGGSASTTQVHGFIAGGIAGAAGVLVGQPFDTLKVRAQVGDTATRRLSLRGLYVGVIPPILTTGTLRALNFGVFEATKAWIADRGYGRCDALSTTFVAACLAGGANSAITAPVVTLKIRQQTHGGSLLKCLREGISGGVHSFYRGFPLHFGCEAFGNSCYLTTYFATKLWMNDDSFATRLFCGACAGWAGWISIYPLDVLRSRAISSGAFQDKAPSPMEAARACYREGGVRAFYRGLGVALLRAAPVSGVVLPVYDYVLDLLCGKRTLFGFTLSDRGERDRDRGESIC